MPLVGDATVIFLMTAAYRRTGINGSSGLGGFDEFTERLAYGYTEYKSIFPKSEIAPVGLAYKYIRDKLPRSIWEGL